MSGVFLFVVASGLPRLAGEAPNGWFPRLSFSVHPAEGAAAMGVLVAIVLAIHVALWQPGRAIVHRAGAERRRYLGRSANDARLARLDAIGVLTGWLALCLGIASLVDGWPFSPLSWVHLSLFLAGVALFVISTDRPERLWRIWERDGDSLGRRRQRLWEQERRCLPDGRWTNLGWWAALAVWAGLVWAIADLPGLWAEGTVNGSLIICTWMATLLWRLGRLDGWAFSMLGILAMLVTTVTWIGLFAAILARDEDPTALVISSAVAVLGSLGVSWDSLRESPWTRGPLTEAWSLYVEYRVMSGRREKGRGHAGHHPRRVE